MNNIIKCQRCRKTLFGEEYDSHLCSPIPNGSKIVEIDYYIIHKDDFGNIFIITKTIEGLLLTLKKSILSAENKQQESPTESHNEQNT